MDKIIERSIKRLYDKKVETGHPDPELWKANADALWQAVQQGYNTPVDKMEFGSRQHAQALQMRYNTATTMAFKLHHNSLEMGRELFNPDGSIRTFSEFKKAVQPIARDYNKNWLKTEWRTAKGMAQAADNWLRLTARPGKLKYNTQQDGNVRDAHALLQGMVKPKNWPGWKTYAPKNDWNCRCWLTSVPEDSLDVDAKSFPEIKKMFRMNPGITGEVFGKGTPYFEMLAAFGALAGADFGLSLVSKNRLKRRLKQFNRFSKKANYEQAAVDNRTGGHIFIEKGARDQHEFEKNFQTAQSMFKNGYGIVLKNRKETGKKQADGLVDGKLTELKTVGGHSVSNIANAFKDTIRQADAIALEFLTWNPVFIARQLKGSFLARKALRRIYVIHKNKVLLLDRKTILNDLHWPMIRNLF